MLAVLCGQSVSILSIVDRKVEPGTTLRVACLVKVEKETETAVMFSVLVKLR